MAGAIWLLYFKLLGYKYVPPLGFLYMVTQAAQVASTWWIQRWTSATQTEGSKADSTWYLEIYSAILFGASFLIFVRAFIFVSASLQVIKLSRILNLES